MVNEFDIYDLHNYLTHNVEREIHDFVTSSFINDVKKLGFSDSMNYSNELLDQISYHYYGTELLWWAIAFYNDIIDPMIITNRILYIPNRTELDSLLIRYIEKTRLGQ